MAILKFVFRVSEELSSMEISACANLTNLTDNSFHKNLVVWKFSLSFFSFIFTTPVSEELSSMEINVLLILRGSDEKRFRRT